MRLSDLKTGEMAKIIGLDLKNREVKKHLLDMGITRGTIVKIKKISPTGDPIDIEQYIKLQKESEYNTNSELYLKNKKEKFKEISKINRKNKNK